MSIEEEKEVQYYAAIVNAWFSTRIEHDKALLNLSSLGIGLLITLLSTVGSGSRWATVCYFFALLTFTVCASCLIRILYLNSKFLEELVEDENAESPRLRTLDRVSGTCFFAGVSFTALIGMSFLF